MVREILWAKSSQKDQLDAHLQTVTIDSRVKVEEVRAIQDTIVPRFVDLPKPNLVSQCGLGVSPKSNWR